MVAMNIFYILVLLVFSIISCSGSRRKDNLPARNMVSTNYARNETRNFFLPQSEKQNNKILRGSGWIGDDGDDDDLDKKPPYGFPFAIFWHKYAMLHSVFWKAQKEISEFASRQSNLGLEHKSLEENDIVMKDFAFQGQLNFEVSFFHNLFLRKSKVDSYTWLSKSGTLNEKTLL